MRAMVSVILVSATVSVLAACSGPQNASSAPQAANSSQVAQAAATSSQDEKVYSTGSRIKQPKGAVPVQASTTYNTPPGGW